MNELQQFERSTCDCGKCVAACETMPGMLAPGDMDHMAMAAGYDLENADQCEAFMLDHLAASSGALAVGPDGPFRIPTIVPKQDENGHCVFLKEGKCSIHNHSPFGCRNFNPCDGDESVEEDERKMRLALEHCLHSLDYQMTWAYLNVKGNNAKPLQERREAYEKRLDEIE